VEALVAQVAVSETRLPGAGRRSTFVIATGDSLAGSSSPVPRGCQPGTARRGWLSVPGGTLSARGAPSARSRANREGAPRSLLPLGTITGSSALCLRAAGTPEGGRQGVAFHDHDPQAPSHGYEAAIGAPFGVPIVRLAGRKGEGTANPFLWAPPTRRPPVTTLPPERVDRRTTERGPARCGPPATGGRAPRD